MSGRSVFRFSQRLVPLFPLFLTLPIEPSLLSSLAASSIETMHDGKWSTITDVDSGVPSRNRSHVELASNSLPACR